MEPRREPPNLAQLRVFRTIAEVGSASGAAARLHRAQSAITRSLQELEHWVGEKLFERRAAGMMMTPAARVVLKRADRVFHELEEVAAWCLALQNGRRPTTERPLPAYLLNTRRLQLTVSLARHRHMPSAAHALGISQPAVSSAIRILETGAGIRLFHRHARGLVLTTEGETFVLHIRRALNELRHIEDDLAAARGVIQGSVTIGALPLGRTLILPAAIARISAACPQVRISTDESAYETLVANLRAGDIDFVLGALRQDDPASGLVNEKLMSEELVVIARAGHPLASLQDLTLAQLVGAQWILPRPNAPARATIDGIFARQRLKPPQPTVETADLAVIRGLLLATDMLAVQSAQQLHYECRSGELKILDIALKGTRRDIGLIMRAGGTPSPAARVLIDCIREALRAMPSAAARP
ncbi:LysR family transcriptional regulator [Burkholderia plantarii]|uniref:Transcriptional regulator LysR family n=1 Tax=Burkholderia plantarii TaxID=41899 RepID=A0A0B6RXS4_BURPL|nr:LysR family transcriptional regulator [Burkholderia plantarii]AJK50177.1 transcriptional regulator LysR family [Burkholderia plantarii]ALK34336.1 LysR family transcriptional regulator [Burkholderia plantarii]GLZ22122.1 transcriptional regulator [Burkholderia plantarii]